MDASSERTELISSRDLTRERLQIGQTSVREQFVS